MTNKELVFSSEITLLNFIKTKQLFKINFQNDLYENLVHFPYYIKSNFTLYINISANLIVSIFTRSLPEKIALGLLQIITRKKEEEIVLPLSEIFEQTNRCLNNRAFIS